MNYDDLIETRRVLGEYGEATVSSMRNILVSSGKVASGELVRSLAYEITYDGQDISLEFSMAEYGVFVDKGRKPGKMPPISSISDWLRVKGIPTSAAFPIARKIGMKGIKPTPFFESTVDRTLASLVDSLSEAFAKDVENYVIKQLQS